MAAKKKPEPISKFIVCSSCGLSWDAHGDDQTVEKCVELLKNELAKRPNPQGWLGVTGIQPYPAQLK